jgi:hypothetical protein
MSSDSMLTHDLTIAYYNGNMFSMGVSYQKQ